MNYSDYSGATTPDTLSDGSETPASAPLLRGEGDASGFTADAMRPGMWLWLAGWQ